MLIWAFHATVAPAPRDLTSWHAGCPVPISISAWSRSPTGASTAGRTHGSLVLNRDAVRPVVRALRSLLSALPHPAHGARRALRRDDDRSMAADNTSAFNCRGRGQHVLVAARLRAGDRRQPAREPVHLGARRPPAGRPAFLDRSLRRRGMIHAGDAVVRAFASVGWGWGGAWPRRATTSTSRRTGARRRFRTW